MTKKRDTHPHQSSSTQVSLVPPPWLLFTTSEPRVIATRVRPPGVIVRPCGDIRTRGRKSTWREIGRAHVCTPVTNAHLVCRLLLEKNKKHTLQPRPQTTT